jgi:hypothetical protein
MQFGGGGVIVPFEAGYRRLLLVGAKRGFKTADRY